MFIFSLLPSVLINDLYSIRNILKIPTSLLLLIEYFFSYILIISMSIFNLILLFFCFLFRVLIIPYFF